MSEREMWGHSRHGMKVSEPDKLKSRACSIPGPGLWSKGRKSRGKMCLDMGLGVGEAGCKCRPYRRDGYAFHSGTSSPTRRAELLLKVLAVR